jgi:hypothetical protein
VSDADEIRYWQGMVVCPRKALSHITHTACLQLHGQHTEACGSCTGHVIVAFERSKAQEKENDKLCKIKNSRNSS